MSRPDAIYYGPDWVAITSQRAEVSWVGPTRKASEADLARLASDVFAMEAGEEPRWFDRYSSDTTDEEDTPPYFTRKPAPTQEVPTKPAAVHAIGAVMIRHGRCFAARRAPHKSLAGLWEFPGGKPEAGESPQDTLARELREEFGVVAEVGPWLVRGCSPDGLVALDLHIARWTISDTTPTDHDQLGWFTPDELARLPMPPADIAALPVVLGAMRADGFLHPDQEEIKQRRRKP